MIKFSLTLTDERLEQLTDVNEASKSVGNLLMSLSLGLLKKQNAKNTIDGDIELDRVFDCDTECAKRTVLALLAARACINTKDKEEKTASQNNN